MLAWITHHLPTPNSMPACLHGSHTTASLLPTPKSMHDHACQHACMDHTASLLRTPNSTPACLHGSHTAASPRPTPNSMPTCLRGSHTTASLLPETPKIKLKIIKIIYAPQRPQRARGPLTFKASHGALCIIFQKPGAYGNRRARTPHVKLHVFHVFHFQCNMNLVWNKRWLNEWHELNGVRWVLWEEG